MRRRPPPSACDRSPQSIWEGVSQVYGPLLRASLVVSVCASTLAQKKLPAAPIDLNTATVDQLQQLPGIGPATVQAIVRFREKSGSFQRPEDLLAIHGISKSRFEKRRPYITVFPPAKKP